MRAASITCFGAGCCDFGFTSSGKESYTKLLDYNAHFYSPRLGRFISADTVVPNPGKSIDFDRFMYAAGNSLRYNDPSGHNPDDPNVPEYWTTRGVKFYNFSAEQIQEMIQSLNYVLNALGYDVMYNALGLENGLTFVGYTDPDLYAAETICPADQSCYDADLNTINIWNPSRDFEVNPEVLVHEMGHAFDHHAAVGESRLFSIGIGTDLKGREDTGYWVNNVDGWSLENSEWNYDGSNDDLASTYGLKNPLEDVAETFTWYVHSQNGMQPAGYNEPSETRQNALSVAIAYLTPPSIPNSLRK